MKKGENSKWNDDSNSFDGRNSISHKIKANKVTLSKLHVNNINLCQIINKFTVIINS